MTGKITIDRENAIFQLTGADRFLAIKNKVVVPIDHLVSVSTDDASWGVFTQLKIAGARIPGVVKDGRFLSKDGVLFYSMHHPEKCVTVELRDEQYTKIIFEVEDKDEAYMDLMKAIRAANAANPSWGGV